MANEQENMNINVTIEDLGNNPVTPQNVKKYLMHPDGGNLKADVAEELVENYASSIQRGADLGSFTYYVADNILRAEEL